MIFRQSELFAGLAGSAMQIKGRLAFDRSAIRGGKVDLASAKISDVLETDAATFDADSPLDITTATIARLRLAASTLAGGLLGDDAEMSGLLLIDGTSILGPGLVARGLTVNSFLKINGGTTVSRLDLAMAHITLGLLIDGKAHFGRDGVDLQNAGVDGTTSIVGSVDDGGFVADGATFGKGLRVSNVTALGPLSLHRILVGGDLKVDHTNTSRLASQKMRITGSLYLDHDGIGGGIDMQGSWIGADTEIVATTVEGDFDLDQVVVGKQLDLEDGTNVGGTGSFVSVNVGGDFLIGNNAKLSPVTLAKSDLGLARLANNMFVHNAAFLSPPIMVGADIKGHLDLASAQLPGLDLTRASIGGDFRLAARDAPHRATAWSSTATLVLKNAHVGVIQDQNQNADGAPWPKKVDIDGFTFDHFGDDPPLEWIDAQWLQKGEFQPASYARLAKYYGDEGRKEQNEDILFAEKTRETGHAWNNCVEFNLGSCVHALSLTALRGLIGYGIGNRLFWALYWVVGFTLFGAAMLRRTRNDAQDFVLWGGKDKGRLWCVGASINQLIPIVELNKEFKDFFDDPHRRHLSSLQLIYFAVHAIMGYVLGSFVVAAIAGLTQAH